MSAFTAIVKTINWINEWVGDKLAYLLFGFFLLILLQVILRYIFNAPTVWASELSQMLFGAYVILSGGYILRRGGHVNVDILYSRLPPKARALTDIYRSVIPYTLVELGGLILIMIFPQIALWLPRMLGLY